MKKLLSVLLISIMCHTIKAQTAEDSVRAVILRFFEGMKNTDTTALRACVTEGVIFQTITRKSKDNPTMIVRTDDVNTFISLIGTMNKGDADERIEFKSVQTDSHLASVWTPYKFYLKGNFSHCGANSFQLVRIGGDWKIQYLIDTRRRDCGM